MGIAGYCKHMTLKEYIDTTPGMTVARMMWLTGVSYPTLSAVYKGQKPIGRYAVAKTISEATDGQVTIEELCEIDG